MKKLLSMVIAAGALLGAQARAADEFDLKIFHVNDSHSYVEPVNTFLTIDNDKYLAQIGGMNAILNYMNTHSEGNVLRLHGGDFQTGNGTYFNYYHGRDDYEILKELKFEAVVIGNHEFDHGNDFLAELVAGLKSGKNAMKVLSANLKVPFENRLTPMVDPYVILERGGEKIAVIGITSGDKVNASSKPDKGTFFTNEADTINKLVAELQKQGINKFIALTHQGVENDIPMASKVHGIDVWITADSHTVMGHQLHKLGVPTELDYPEMAKNLDGNNACIVQAGSTGAILGELNVKFDKDGNVIKCDGAPQIIISSLQTANAEELDPKKKEAAMKEFSKLDFVSFYDPKKDPSSELINGYINETHSRLQYLGTNNNALCQTRVPGEVCLFTQTEQSHGCEVCTSLSYILAKKYPGAIILQNAGNYRTFMWPGKIYNSDVNNVLAFANNLVSLEINGEELEKLIDSGIESYTKNPSRDGSFPTGYGVRFDLDYNVTDGKFISNLEYRSADGWVPVKKDQKYTIIVNEYIATGADGYGYLKTLIDDPSHNAKDLGQTISYETIEVLKKDPKIDKLPASEMFVQKLTLKK